MNSYLPFPLKYRVQTPSLVCSKCLIDVNSPNYFFIIINFSSYHMLWYYDLLQLSLVCLEKFSSFKIWLKCHFPWEFPFYPFCPECPLSAPQKGYLFFFSQCLGHVFIITVFIALRWVVCMAFHLNVSFSKLGVESWPSSPSTFPRSSVNVSWSSYQMLVKRPHGMKKQKGRKMKMGKKKISWQKKMIVKQKTQSLLPVLIISIQNLTALCTHSKAQALRWVENCLGLSLSLSSGY